VVIPIDLRGKTAFVTGASQGLGQQTATHLHAAGANVAIGFWDDPDGANRELAEGVAETLGERSMIVGGDVRQREEMANAMDQVVSNFGTLDIVVCNAGILRDRSVKKMTQEEWQSVIDTNLTGVFNTCQVAADRLGDGGRIINMASLAAVIGFFGQANYASAKAGVIALTKVLSKELARRNITVNAVSPGVVMTEMGKSIPEENRRQMISQIPLGRFGEPSEISGCVLFLASDLASYVTGQTLHVNGGWWG
jgi:3-oxoacyl-[acyl-carrier protein] reductase